MRGVQGVQVLGKYPLRVRARDAYKQRTCTTCTPNPFSSLEAPMSDRHQLIAATLLLALAVHLGSMTLLLWLS